MDRLTLKAVATTTTDQGVFTAVISTSSVDREKDVVMPVAMVAALRKWNRPIPLAWNHSTKAEDIIGHIDPQSVKEADGEVVASGKVDLESGVGQEAWRSFRSRSIGFSFGYLIPEGGSSKRKGGGRQINNLDVFEVTATPTPMNNDTRVLNTKAAEPRDEQVLRKEADRFERERIAERLPKAAESEAPEVKALARMLSALEPLLSKQGPMAEEDDPADMLDMMLSMAQTFIDSEAEPEDVVAMREIADRLQELGAKEEAESEAEPEPAKSAQELRGQSDRLEREQQSTSLTLANATKGARPVDVNARLEEAQAALLALELFDPPEVAGLHDGLLKAVWTAAYVNTLPDSSFLYVESGGSKDDEGKTTPRSLRHFPYKDAGGSVDLPHLRNALARIPQSNLSQDIKDRLTARAQRLLDNQKSANTDREPTRARSADSLRKRSNQAVLEIQSDGRSLRKSPPVKEQPEPEPASVAELRRRSRDLMLNILTETE